jgi:hypothetical protein
MSSTRKTFSQVCLLIVTITFVVLALWIMFSPRLYIIPKMQNNLNKTRILQQKLDSKSLIYKELLIDSNNMYSRNFDKLIMIGGILFAGIGILFPVLMFFFQKQSLQDEKDRIIEEAKKEIQEAQKRNQEEFHKLEEQIKNETKKLWIAAMSAQMNLASTLHKNEPFVATCLYLSAVRTMIGKNVDLDLIKIYLENFWELIEVDQENIQEEIAKFTLSTKKYFENGVTESTKGFKIIDDFEKEFDRRLSEFTAKFKQELDTKIKEATPAAIKATIKRDKLQPKKE